MSSESHGKILVIALVVVSLIVLGIILQPTVHEAISPKPRTAWVAIEAADSGIAKVGPVEIEVGTRFTLHAVIEADDRDGEPVYYTRAHRLSMFGKEVDPQLLRTWDRPPRIVRVRWFTIEGSPPYAEVTSAADMERFHFEEIYRAGWVLEWSIPGQIDAAFDDHLTNGSAAKMQRFGTQSYHVRVELYDHDDDLLPRQRIPSWGAEDFEREVARFPRVQQVLPGAVPASRAFGQAQLELSTDDAEVRSRFDTLVAGGLVFSRLRVLRDQIEAAGKTLDSLVWRAVDLRGEVSWDEARRGDLLRAGDRMVVLYEDRGVIGRLDDADLCFDYVRGATVRPLGDVFAGDGELELASLFGQPRE